MLKFLKKNTEILIVFNFFEERSSTDGHPMGGSKIPAVTSAGCSKSMQFSKILIGMVRAKLKVVTARGGKPLGFCKHCPNRLLSRSPPDTVAWPWPDWTIASVKSARSLFARKQSKAVEVCPTAGLENWQALLNLSGALSLSLSLALALFHS